MRMVGFLLSQVSTATWEHATDLLIQRDVGVEWGVLAGVAYVQHELAGVDGPLLVCFVPVAEGAGVEGQRDVFGFAGGEADFIEAFQFALGTGGLRGWVGDVELGYFCAFSAAGVGYVEGDRYG